MILLSTIYFTLAEKRIYHFIMYTVMLDMQTIKPNLNTQHDVQTENNKIHDNATDVTNAIPNV